jgi:3-deoxy-D-manno-octulosonic-acid transferase
VGEVGVAIRCLTALRRARPDLSFVLTTVTPEGRALARQHVRPPDRVEWFPFDAPSCIRRSFDALAPEFVVLCEVELWPNHLREARRRGLPVFVVNARLSQQDERNYRKAGAFMRSTFAVPEIICARSEEDAARFRRLGAGRVVVTGDMKCDPLPPEEESRADLAALVPREGTFLLGASTHDGEETILIEAFLRCREAVPGIMLVLAPRHPTRAPAVRAEAAGRGLREGRDVIVVDRVGLLPSLYAGATAAFVGKSLTAHGGQNFLEAVQAGCPVVFGPHMENFGEAAATFAGGGGAWQIKDARDLADALRLLLQEPALRDDLRRRASALLETRTGATARTVDTILAHLGGQATRHAVVYPLTEP